MHQETQRQPSLSTMRVLAAVDKFRGTATAAQVAAAIGHACWDLGHECIETPIGDGGEGTLDVLGGANRTTRVTNPLGKPVDAQWRFVRDTAIIEMARASGLTLVGGAAKNDVIAASTVGTGELIDSALNDGAKKIIVCVGGSATVDGGLGAIKAIKSPARLRGIEFLVACDVQTSFTDAAKLFGAQKGATPAQIEFLTARLHKLQQQYLDDYGVDVSNIEGAGAAGGLAGGLAALGASLVPGFDIVADEVGLHELIASSDYVITGEGYLDNESFEGKVVGGVQRLAQQFGKPVSVICGDADAEVRQRIDAVTLIEMYGERQAFDQTLTSIESEARELLQKCTAKKYISLVATLFLLRPEWLVVGLQEACQPNQYPARSTRLLRQACLFRLGSEQASQQSLLHPVVRQPEQPGHQILARNRRLLRFASVLLHSSSLPAAR